MLIVCHFDKKQATQATITIPADAWQAMKLVGNKPRIYKDIFRTKSQFKGTDKVAVNLPPLGALVLAIS